MLRLCRLCRCSGPCLSRQTPSPQSSRTSNSAKCLHQHHWCVCKTLSSPSCPNNAVSLCHDKQAEITSDLQFVGKAGVADSPACVSSSPAGPRCCSGFGPRRIQKLTTASHEFPSGCADLCVSLITRSQSSCMRRRMARQRSLSTLWVVLLHRTLPVDAGHQCIIVSSASSALVTRQALMAMSLTLRATAPCPQCEHDVDRARTGTHEDTTSMLHMQWCSSSLCCLTFAPAGKLVGP